MLCLPSSLLEHFKNGGFVASIKGNTWSSVALDESHEMCINKDVKAAISKLSDDYISKIVSYLPYRAKSLKNFRSQLEVFSARESSKSIKFSSKDDELMEYNVKKLINAIKHYDLLPFEFSKNNKKRSHTQLDSRKQVIAFQDRVITINIKEAQHPLK